MTTQFNQYPGSAYSRFQDTQLLPYEYRPPDALAATHKAALLSLKDISEGPDELVPLLPHMMHLKNGPKSATALRYHNHVISVRHLIDNEHVGARFTFDNQMFTLVSDGSQTSFGQRDISVFSSSTSDSDTTYTLGPLTEDSYMLLFDEDDNIKFLKILVDPLSKSFNECTAPGFSGAIIVSNSFLYGFQISGIHIGEGRILDQDQINAHCNLPGHTPHDLHLDSYYEEQVKPTPSPTYFRTDLRPRENRLEFPSLFLIEEQIDVISDHALYGIDSNNPNKFSQTQASGRHFADTFATARAIAEKQLPSSNFIPLSIVKWPSVNRNKLKTFIQSYQGNELYVKNPKMITVSMDKLGIGAVWVLCRDGKKIRVRKMTANDQQVCIKLNLGVEGKLVLSHFAVC